MSTLTLEYDTTEERPSGVWDYISPSRLNKWLKCPLAYKLYYIDGIKMPTNANLFLGKMVHQGLEVFFRHRQLGVDLSPEDVATRMLNGWDEAVESESMRFVSSQEEGTLKKKSVDLVALYLVQTADDNDIPIAVETSMEAPLVDPETGEDLGIPLIGIVDLIVDDKGGSLICDFKTASKSSAPSEVTHEIQLSSYAYLFRQAAGDEEGGLEIRSLIKTKTPKIEFHRYEARSDAHFRRLFSVIRAYLADLDTGRFVFRPGFGCLMCDFRDNECRDWGG